MQIELIQKKRVAEIVLKKEPANAYDFSFMKDLNALLDEIEKMDSVTVVLINSALPKFFCAGADLKVFAKNTIAENDKMVALASNATAKIEASKKIFIAAIAGHCLGGGLELAMACDLRIAKAGNYLLGLPEINVGLIPGNGGTQRLLRIVGPSKAMSILLNRKNFSPKHALEIGLINELFPVEDWDRTMENYAQHLSEGPSMAMAATKRAVLDGAYLNITDGLKLEQQLLKPLNGSADNIEGMKAFNEKRQPTF
ncbi:enoyl-CoA hydratase [Arcticibacterium luteifluviistationis]|uniref:Enoyl-CoA hydratase n=2 Tax=Arcticibacterium luteifluviistationis TaxID=1784714 RepID=A0A2Z4GHD9_9BACT|nr:enoyl-CoA hydratase [Arcticibacterium luteifluviistationis]